MHELFEHVALAFELLAVVVLISGILIAAVLSVRHAISGSGAHSYEVLHQHVGRGLLLALELLIAADIIQTLTVAPTFNSLGVLGLLVLIRTFLSFTLSLELHGRWPWQQRPSSNGGS